LTFCWLSSSRSWRMKMSFAKIGSISARRERLPFQRPSQSLPIP
jgi:hypothetical protein